MKCQNCSWINFPNNACISFECSHRSIQCSIIVSLWINFSNIAYKLYLETAQISRCISQHYRFLSNTHFFRSHQTRISSSLSAYQFFSETASRQSAQLLESFQDYLLTEYVNAYNILVFFVNTSFFRSRHFRVKCGGFVYT